MQNGVARLGRTRILQTAITWICCQFSKQFSKNFCLNVLIDKVLFKTSNLSTHFSPKGTFLGIHKFALIMLQIFQGIFKDFCRNRIHWKIYRKPIHIMQSLHLILCAKNSPQNFWSVFKIVTSFAVKFSGSLACMFLLPRFFYKSLSLVCFLQRHFSLFKMGFTYFSSCSGFCNPFIMSQNLSQNARLSFKFCKANIYCKILWFSYTFFRYKR